MAHGHSHTTGLAYSLVAYDPPHDLRTAALLPCVECERKDKVIISGFGNNPDRINKTFIKLGWDADVWHPAQNWCPRCVKRREIRVQKDLGVRQLVESAEEIANQRPSPPRRPPPEHFAIGASTRTQQKDEPVTDMKKLSLHHKGLLRTALELHFNPDTGQYEKDWSDHRVSEELQIARRVVQEFRDTFYGELQQDPEIVSLRQMLDEAKRFMGNLQSSLQKIDAKADGLFKKHGGA